MGNDSASEKTEEPTPKKIRDARQKGQVSKSNDVIATVILSCILLLFVAMWAPSLERMCEMLVVAPIFYENQTPIGDGILAILKVAFCEWFIVSFPFVAVAMVAGIAANVMQVGGVFAPEAVKPDINKLNPIEGAKKIFSVKNIVEFLKSCLKVIVIGFVVYVLVKSYIDPLTKLPYLGIFGVLDLLRPILFNFYTTILIVYVFIAGFDYFFQKKQYIKQLRMTKDEVKREYKEMEGDPEIKGKRKQIHQEMVMNDTVQNTKKSSVLVTNPTHYAIAIYYDPQKTKLPVVMAKGEDFMATQMIKAAQEANVPIMRNVALAQELFREAPLKQFIPRDLLKPVAEILVAIQQLKNEGLS